MRGRIKVCMRVSGLKNHSIIRWGFPHPRIEQMISPHTQHKEREGREQTHMRHVHKVYTDGNKGMREMRRRMKECGCGKTNQSLDGSEPLPKDQAANLPTHSTPKTERKGKQYTPCTSNGANRREIKKTGDENLVFEGFQLIFDLRSA